MLLLLFPLAELIPVVVLQSALAALAFAWFVPQAALPVWIEWILVAAPLLFLLMAVLLVLENRWTGGIAAVAGILFAPAFYFAGRWLVETPYEIVRWGYWGGAVAIVAVGIFQLLLARRRGEG